MGQAKARRAAAKSGQTWPRDRVAEAEVPTGSPTEWLRRDRRDAEMAVPCGSCQACCAAGYPIELDDGTVLPLREDGSCPKLIDGACSIYGGRPAICRNYDCRRYVFAGVAPDDLVGRSLSRWQLTADTAEDHGSGQPKCASAPLERVLLTGTRSAESIMASGHGNKAAQTGRTHGSSDQQVHQRSGNP